MGYKNCLDLYIQATNTHHFENVKQLLHPEAIYWFSDQCCTSMIEIQNYFENAWNVINEEIYAASNIHWIAVDEKTATCVYTYHYEGYIDGEFVKGSGRATNVFVKESQYDWKLIHEHLSSL